MPDPDGSAAPVPSAPLSSLGRRQRKHRLLRRLLALGAVMLIAVAGAAAWVGMALRQRDPSLLAQATNIMDMQNCPEYAWKSDHEIARYSYHQSGTGYSVYDTNTHVTTLIVTFNFQGGMSTGPRQFFYPKPDLVKIEIWDNTPEDWATRKFQTQTPPDHVIYLRKVNGITQQDVNWGGSSSVVSPHNDLVAWWFPRTQQAPGGPRCCTASYPQSKSAHKA